MPRYEERADTGVTTFDLEKHEVRVVRSRFLEASPQASSADRRNTIDDYEIYNTMEPSGTGKANATYDNERSRGSRTRICNILVLA